MSPKSAEGAGVESRFLTLEDVSAYLNVSVPQVYAWIDLGTFLLSSLAAVGFGA